MHYDLLRKCFLHYSLPQVLRKCCILHPSSLLVLSHTAEKSVQTFNSSWVLNRSQLNHTSQRTTPCFGIHEFNSRLYNKVSINLSPTKGDFTRVNWRASSWCCKCKAAALPMGGTLQENSIMRVFHADWVSSFFAFFHIIDWSHLFSGIPCSMLKALKSAHKESLLLSLGILEVKLLPPELKYNCTSQQWAS